MRALGRLRVAPALGLLLLARTAGAADGDCSGTWRFQVAPPEPEKEAWLSPQSWCRAQRLPRTLGPATASANGWLVVIHRGEGVAFGLRLTRNEGAWQLDQITKSMLVGKP